MNELMPHPVYAWMGWVQVLSPTDQTMRDLTPLLTEAYKKALAAFDKRVGTPTLKHGA